MSRHLRIPARLNSPPKVFFWDMDIFFIVILGLGIGIFTKMLILALTASFLLVWLWSKAKTGQHPWFFVHSVAWYLPEEVSLKNERMPPSSIKEFLR